MSTNIHGDMNMIKNAIATHWWWQLSLWSSCTLHLKRILLFL